MLKDGLMPKWIAFCYGARGTHVRIWPKDASTTSHVNLIRIVMAIMAVVSASSAVFIQYYAKSMVILHNLIPIHYQAYVPSSNQT